VERSRYGEEARELLEAGWSPTRVRLYLVESHGEQGVPSEKALERFKKAGKVRPLKVLPARMVTEALKSLRRKVDLLRALDDMILFQQERLIWLRARELEKGEPEREISRSLRVLDFYLERKERLCRELGMLPVPPQGPDDGQGVPDDGNGRELEPMSEEDYQDMMDVLRRHGEWLNARVGERSEGSTPAKTHLVDGVSTELGHP
jgi:hypothetical protein